MRRSTRVSALIASACLAATAFTVAPAGAIVGGYQVTDHRFAFMASIQSKGSEGTDGHFCGGSVVSARWVLTAAHCVEGTKPGEIQVGVGRDNLDDLSTGQTLSLIPPMRSVG